MISLYDGCDSFGRGVQMATDGERWFQRVYGFNGYGRGWSKWTACEAPVMPDYVENRYSGEKLGVARGSIVEWGFNHLRLCKNTRVRLPK